MKLLILGRDGVISPLTDAPMDRPENWKPLPGSLESIARLYRDGYRIVIITHQPAVAQGRLSMETLNRVHARMLDLVRHKGGDVESIMVCPHVKDGECQCCPPLPGLFGELAERLKINLSGVTAVLATDDELTAARLAGAQPVHIAQEGIGVQGVSLFGSLQDFSDALLTGHIPSG